MGVGQLVSRLKNNRLAKDSFWAVFGNGFGNALFLLVGIIIARLLGKDLYGEYGVVKSTMFYIAMFASFGLGTTATKFIASKIQEQQNGLRQLINDIIYIAFIFSVVLAVILLFFSQWLADFVSAPQLGTPFKFLAIIIVFRALSTAQTGILSGFKSFKVIAKNSVLSGLFLLLFSVPLCYYKGLNGALVALTASQIFNFYINFIALRMLYKDCPKDIGCKSQKMELVRYSFPIALQECCVSLTNWLAILMLTKLSSLGELGIYSASIQWNAIVSFIPTLLMNVILSHIVSSTNDKQHHNLIFKQMIIVNITSTIIPVAVFFIFIDLIAGFYGQSFDSMNNVMRILILVPILESCGSIFKAEYVAKDKNWLYFIFRLIRDISMLVLSYYLLSVHQGTNGAFYYAISILFASALFLILLVLGYYRIENKSKLCG